ncbi:CLUMA_CG013282, isoform A [Clunio marinus]|uniref:CLUMA_CG013282, isoform A n=1 Tax=Clunio marinus TaxID=568069 RepID=A0A1J1IIB0_9DIPT|nr:CLUMA_CG013282, isoform A [Clunio marinus]
MSVLIFVKSLENLEIHEDSPSFQVSQEGHFPLNNFYKSEICNFCRIFIVYGSTKLTLDMSSSCNVINKID